MMKKIWNARKDSEGVSPVIATILMVAITVVLAAILMVMVMGMTDSGTTTPTIAQINVEAAGATSLTVTVVSIVPSAEVGKVTFTLNDGATGITETDWDNTAATSVNSGSVATLTVPALAAGPLNVKILVDGVVAGQKSIIVS